LLVVSQLGGEMSVAASSDGTLASRPQTETAAANSSAAERGAMGRAGAKGLQQVVLSSEGGVGC
jgi:hypothetical protein